MLKSRGYPLTLEASYNKWVDCPILAKLLSIEFFKVLILGSVSVQLEELNDNFSYFGVRRFRTICPLWQKPHLISTLVYSVGIPNT